MDDSPAMPQLQRALQTVEPKLLSQLLNESNQPYTAKNLFSQLRDSIIQFENSLDADHEVGVRLVSFGQATQFSVTCMGYINPSLIWFQGILPDGSVTKLIQHTSQISFLLIAMKRNPNRQKQLIGFVVSPQEASETSPPFAPTRAVAFPAGQEDYPE